MQFGRVGRFRAGSMVVLLGLLGLLTACGGPGRSVPAKIESLEAVPSTIVAGEESTISWRVSGDFVSLRLTTEAGVVADKLSATGSRTVRPTETTLYTLTARNRSGVQTTRAVTVVVQQPPAITSFTANPASIGVGESSTLSWEVTGDVESIAILEGGAAFRQDLDAVGTLAVSPPQTTEYTLVVQGQVGDPIEQSVTIAVATPAVIISFTATPSTISAGALSTLAWEAAGDVAAVELSAGGTVISSGLAAVGSLSVSPITTTMYTLTVTDSDGADVTSSVTVTVTDPVSIVSFTAVPETIADGGSSTLAWVVDGDVASVTLTAGGTVIAEDLDASGDHLVSPSTTTEYALTATDSAGAEVTDTVTVTVVPAVDVSGVTATVTTLSQVVVSWTVTNADEINVIAVNASDSNDTVAISGGAGLAGNSTTVTLPIPDSTHQVIRVVASNAASEDRADSPTLVNVVLNTGDYDPYDPEGDGSGEAPVPGSLRDTIANAAAGSVIGFAEDVLTNGVIQLPGVEVGGWGDAHLLIDKNLTISAPTAGLTLEGVSGWEPGDPGTAFTWGSRVLQISSGAVVVLDNVTITGGTFIFKGAGIRNLGTLTMNGGAVSGNRAWHTGGGVHNTGSLTLNGTLVADNVAATIDGEVGATFEIRGNPAYTTGLIEVGGWGGGIYNEGGSITLNDVTLEDNSARFAGGGVANGTGSLTIDGGIVQGNIASDASYSDPGGQLKTGGGIYTEAATIVSGTTFASNDAMGSIGDAAIGGALAVRNPGLATVTSTEFNNNIGDYSGATHAWYCDTSTVDSVLTWDAATTFSGNTSRLGGPYNDSTAIPCAAPAPAGRGAMLGSALPSADLLEKGDAR